MSKNSFDICRSILEKLILEPLNKEKLYTLAKNEMYASGAWDDRFPKSTFNPVIFGVNLVVNISGLHGLISLYLDGDCVSLEF